MPNLGSPKLDKIIMAVSFFLGIPLVGLYLIAMIIYPSIEGNWEHVQSVWDRWQSLNVGILAFLASVVAFNISIFNARRQQERDFIASRAFLPEALSSLCSYLKSCTALLIEARQKITQKDTESTLSIPVPNLPIEYKEIFSRCISLAPPDISNHLVKILMKLQIHNTRIKSLSNSFDANSRALLTHPHMLSHFYITGELYALINMMFKTARGLDNFKSDNLSIEHMTNSYLNLEINFETIDGLIEYTKRSLELE